MNLWNNILMLYLMLEVKTSWWNQSHANFFFQLLFLFGLDVPAKEVEDGIFQSWREVPKRGIIEGQENQEAECL